MSLYNIRSTFKYCVHECRQAITTKICWSSGVQRVPEINRPMYNWT